MIFPLSITLGKYMLF